MAGGQLVKGGGFGAIGDIIVGVFGAVLGGVLFDVLGLSAGGGRLGSLIIATVGAVAFLLLLRLIRKD
ncbi:putative membrane protein [Methylocaldum marinum]|uniref:Putative membrane protein n=1 Tax=Methylocaldum marinum TaxID=1432792 RepID=A0A250KVU0_9GAMM|nr:GlsB/YeaQ/YmgE family stress response membrane protein [Methylocaldum marinum]BBA35101.1 putative membrane protein [Methylocaldum marinum]